MVERQLGKADRRATVGRDLASQRLGGVNDLGIRHDAVDQPDALGFLSIHDAAREDKLPRHPQPNEPRHPVRGPRTRDDPELDLGLS